MKTSINNTLSSRYHERQVLAQQVTEFLKLGGKITVIEGVKNNKKIKPKGSVWQGNELQ